MSNKNNNNNNNSLEIHKESEFILFLKTNEIKVTSEIRLVYNMSMYHMCFVCYHNDPYSGNVKHYDSYYDLKKHFMKEHILTNTNTNRENDHAYGLSYDDDITSDKYSNSELIVWNKSKILGLLDHMIILVDNYLGIRKKGISKKGGDKKLIFYKDMGRIIVKIMKEYQIPQLLLLKCLKLTPRILERYTSTYYYSLDDNDRPKWMRALF